MRFCIPIPCFFKNMDFAETIQIIHECGFDAAEMYDWTKIDLKSLRQACETYQVELLSMCTTEFRMTDATYRTDWLEGVKESCKAANELGVKRLISQVGPDTGAPREIQHQNIVETLKQATSILEQYGVTMMLEPLNTYVNHPGYYLTASVEGFDIIREVNHPNAKLIFDIYHQQIMEGNIIPNVTQNLDCIAHLHAAGHPGRHELQFGENDYQNIFKAIDAAGYQGACGLEYNPLLDPIESLKESKRIYASN